MNVDDKNFGRCFSIALPSDAIANGVSEIGIKFQNTWPVFTKIRMFAHSPGEFLTSLQHTYLDIIEETFNEIELEYEAFEMLDSKKKKCHDYQLQSRDECILNHIEKVSSSYNYIFKLVLPAHH